MIVILHADDLKKGTKKIPTLKEIENYLKINASIEGIYSGDHHVMELCEDDVVIFRNGNETAILKKPGEKLK